MRTLPEQIAWVEYHIEFERKTVESIKSKELSDLFLPHCEEHIDYLSSILETLKKAAP